MKSRHLIIHVAIVLILTSCQGRDIGISTPIVTDSPSDYQYQLGLGYGFLGKEILVSVDGNEVLSLVGTQEIETFAQLQGTYMLVSGSSPDQKITISLIVDQAKPFQQVIDLKSGNNIHIYLEESGYQIYNTPALIYE